MGRLPSACLLLAAYAVFACQMAFGNGPETAAGATPAMPPMPPRNHGASPGISLEDLQRIALEHNPTLVQAGMAVRAARGRYLQARLYPNPSIGYAGEDIGLAGTSGQQGAVFRQQIVTGSKIRLGRAVAGHEVHRARWGLDLQRRRVLNDVSAGYYEVVLAQRMIDVNRELVRVGQQGVKIVGQLKAAQEVSRAEVLQVDIEAEKARLALAQAQNRHRIVWRHLTAVLGRPEMEPVLLDDDVTEDLPVLSFEDGIRQLLSRSPELAGARAGVQRARCRLALEYARRVPNLQIELGAKYDATTDETLTDVGLSLPLPLWDRNQGRIVSARADLIAAESEVRRVELDLHARFSAAFEEYADARRRAEAYAGTILPNAQESLTLIRDHPQEFGYLKLLSAQRTLFTVNLEHLANLSRLWARKVELEGMLLSGGLRRIAAD